MQNLDTAGSRIKFKGFKYKVSPCPSKALRVDKRISLWRRSLSLCGYLWCTFDFNLYSCTWELPVGNVCMADWLIDWIRGEILLCWQKYNAVMFLWFACAFVGVLVDLHQAVSQVNPRSKNVPRVLCGSLNVHAFQQLAALRWATEIINNNSWPGEFGIGKLGLTSLFCGSWCVLVRQ